MAPLSSEQVASWVEYAEAPWGRLRTELIWAILERHVSLPPARVLDVGCGLGEIAVRLARAGSEVVAADASEPMVAEAERRAKGAPLRWLAGDLDATVNELSDERFDLVLCHNVLGYVSDPAAGCRRLTSLLAPGGHLSLTVANRAAEPLRLAFTHHDLEGALAAAGDGGAARRSATLGVDLGLSDLDETAAWLEAAGLRVVAVAGQRLVNDYLGAGNELNTTDAGYEAIRRLELALAEREPYRRIAPFLQLVAVSGTGPDTSSRATMAAASSTSTITLAPPRSARR